MQAPSWQHLEPDASAGKEDGPVRSRAVVCDINREMLSVGKQKAGGTGVHAGRGVVQTGALLQFPFGDL